MMTSSQRSAQFQVVMKNVGIYQQMYDTKNGRQAAVQPHEAVKHSSCYKERHAKLQAASESLK